jgi:hypothetical protein
MRCIHVPTFQAQCKSWWGQPSDAKPEPGQIPFLALYAATLCTGLFLMDDASYRDLGYEDSARAKFPKAWWELSFAALEASNWLQAHNIASLQTIM